MGTMRRQSWAPSQKQRAARDQRPLFVTPSRASAFRSWRTTTSGTIARRRAKITRGQKRNICYAISNFLVHRALEQTRNDLCLHDYPAILLGTSAGFDNGALWATHYAVDDIGCLKPLPNIQIYSPSSIESMHASFDEILKQSHPAYMRIGKSEYSDSIAPPKPNRFAIEEKRAKVLVITHGKMLLNSLEAVKMLSGKTSVFAMDRIKPLDSALLKKLFTAYPQIIVVENNFNSGLYNSLCQWVMENGIVPKALVSIATKEDYGKTTGNVAWLEG